jgi:hypothetical protein
MPVLLALLVFGTTATSPSSPSRAGSSTCTAQRHGLSGAGDLKLLALRRPFLPRTQPMGLTGTL